MTKSERIEKLLDLFDKKIHEDIESAFNAEYYIDRALWHILKEWEDSLPELDNYFHKCFRQCDVTDSGHTDMVIWNLLYCSHRFWDIFDKIKINGDKNE